METKYFIHGKDNWFKNPISAPGAFKEGNMAKISPTIKIDISTNSEIVEEIMLGASCSPEEVDAYKSLFQDFCDIFTCSYIEMPSLDPAIVEDHIDTWPNVAPVRQKQRPIHPSKVVAVEAEILHIAGYIAYTTWVSNPVPVNKK